MAAKGKSGGGRKKPTGKALKFLFASGILGKGKSGKTKYNKKRAKTIGNLRKKGVDVRKKYRNTPSGSTRPVIGGSKAAGLRSGAGAGKIAPMRAEAGKRSTGRRVTVTERVPGSTRPNPGARVSVQERAAQRKYQREVLGQPDRPITGGGGTFTVKRKGGAGTVQTATLRAKALKRLTGQRAVATERVPGSTRPSSLQRAGVPPRFNRAGLLMGGGGSFTVKRKASGGKGDGGPTPKPRPDYSSTRAQRVAAGKAVAGRADVQRDARFARIKRGQQAALKYIRTSPKAQPLLQKATELHSTVRFRQRDTTVYQSQAAYLRAAKSILKAESQGKLTKKRRQQLLDAAVNGGGRNNRTRKLIDLSG